MLRFVKMLILQVKEMKASTVFEEMYEVTSNEAPAIGLKFSATNSPKKVPKRTNNKCLSTSSTWWHDKFPKKKFRSSWCYEYKFAHRWSLIFWGITIHVVQIIHDYKHFFEGKVLYNFSIIYKNSFISFSESTGMDA